MMLHKIVVASMAVVFAGAGWCRATQAEVPAPAFRPVLRALVAHTTIPVLLPSWLPATSTGRWADSFVTVDSYVVWLPTWAEHAGKAPHEWHSVSAERVGPKTPPVEGVRVALSGGRVGYYEASEWAARPSDASVTWTRRGVQYTVIEYAGTKEDVVRMANSMVAVGGVGEIPPALRPALPKLRRSGFLHVLLPTYLPPFGKPLPGWQNLTPMMDIEALEDGYLISFSSPKDKYDDTLATLEADKVVTQLGPLTGDPVNLWMDPPATRTKKLLFRGRYVAADPKDPSSSALIRWDAAGFRYQIEWRGASVTQMIRMAESCVAVTFAPLKGNQVGKK